MSLIIICFPGHDISIALTSGFGCRMNVNFEPLIHFSYFIISCDEQDE